MAREREILLVWLEVLALACEETDAVFFFL